MAATFAARHYSRFMTCQSVHYLASGLLGKGTLADLSLRGCRLNGDCPVEVGAVLSLRLVIPNHPQPLQVERVKVRWVRGQVFGVEFVRVAATDLKQLTEIVHALAARPYAAITLG